MVVNEWVLVTATCGIYPGRCIQVVCLSLVEIDRKEKNTEFAAARTFASVS
jgi:hypothetical protein